MARAESCATCRFRVHPAGDNLPRCRRFPMSVPQLDGVHTWPIIWSEDWWCGEYVTSEVRR